MTTPAQQLRGMLRSPRALAALVVAACLTFSVASAGYAAGVEADAHTSLRQEADRLVLSSSSSIETGKAVVAAHLTAAVCVAQASQRLKPAVGAGTRFPPELVEQVSTVVQGAADATPVPAYDPRPAKSPSDDASLDELDAALTELHRYHEFVDAAVVELAADAQHSGVQCIAARQALASLVSEVGLRTDAVVALNPKAAVDARTELAVARDAVVAGETDGLSRWLAAAAKVESTHAAAVLAEQQAEASRQAERDSRAGSDESSSTTPDDLSGLSGKEFWCAITPDSMRTDPITGAQTRIC